MHTLFLEDLSFSSQIQLGNRIPKSSKQTASFSSDTTAPSLSVKWTKLNSISVALNSVRHSRYRYLQR